MEMSRLRWLGQVIQYSARADRIDLAAGRELPQSRSPRWIARMFARIVHAFHSQDSGRHFGKVCIERS
jgi:hypothetical protein